MKKMESNFTILIATYNAANLLSRTLDSLAIQICQDFNVIIQDGASTDNTVDIAISYTAQLPALHLHSEKDTGIYDAWNKALDRWQNVLGKWILFLGAGDTLYNNNVLLVVQEHLCQAPSHILFAGGTMQIVTQGGTVNEEKQYVVAPMSATWHIVPHPATFHNKKLFYYDQFDVSFKIAGDYDFLCRNWTHENGNFQLPLIITKMLNGGMSAAPATTLRTRWETAKVKYRYFPLRSFLFYTICDLGKGVAVTAIHYILGKKSSVVLNWLRNLRGLPPW